MKRKLALILAAVMLAAALASCAGTPNSNAAISANIRVTSSDAESAAAWLTDRLGDALTDRVVIGTNADGYGVDVSALESDGYVVRNLGGEVALFARTKDGLDRAARKYAKCVESGAVIGDVTYHEGHRIKSINIAGRDISEYAIYCEDDAPMKAAAEELASRIAQANGAALAVSADAPAAPYIALRYVHDEALSTVGYRWSVDEDGLTIECSDGYKKTSAHLAVVRFLEKALGWFGLSFGNEALAEADLVSLPVGESGGEVNAFFGASSYTSYFAGDMIFEHEWTPGRTGNFSTYNCCCHGLENNKFAGELSKSGDWSGDQPCFLDDEFFEVAYEDICDYIEAHLAAGEVIGEDFVSVDIAHGDNTNWCKCKKCLAMTAAEGSYSGFVVDWANRISEALNEVYPGLTYGIFAYAGTNKPPKTIRPNELLEVTYCFEVSCDVHPHDGSECDGEEPLNHYDFNIYPMFKNRSNIDMGGNLREWAQITKTVHVWFYTLPAGLVTMSTLHTIRPDMRFFHELGVKTFFWQNADLGYSASFASAWLMAELIWNIDMTDEEYDAYYDRVLEALYGDGWSYVKEYNDVVGDIYENGPCLHCWGGYLIEPYWAAQFDAIYDLLELALPLADCAKQEKRLTMLDSSCLYSGCVSSYFAALEEGDDDRVAELSRRYGLMIGRAEKLNLRIGGPNDTTLPLVESIAPDLELEAWANTRIWHSRPDTSEMPERVSTYLAEKRAEN